MSLRLAILSLGMALSSLNAYAAAPTASWLAYMASLTALVTSPASSSYNAGDGDFKKTWTGTDGRTVTDVVLAPRLTGTKVNVSMSSCNTSPAVISGSIAGQVLTVSTAVTGNLLPGMILTDNTADLAPGTMVWAALGNGTYLTGTPGASNSQTIALETMAALPDAQACITTALTSRTLGDEVDLPDTTYTFTGNSVTYTAPAGLYSVQSRAVSTTSPGQIQPTLPTDILINGQGASIVCSSADADSFCFYLDGVRTQIANLTIYNATQRPFVAQMQSGPTLVPVNAHQLTVADSITASVTAGSPYATLNVTAAPNKGACPNNVIQSGAPYGTQIVYQTNNTDTAPCGTGSYLIYPSPGSIGSTTMSIGSATVGHMVQWNNTSHAFQVGGDKFYFATGASQGPIINGSGNATSAAFPSGDVGNYYLVFPHYYGQHTIGWKGNTYTNQLSDLSLSNVTIKSSPGACVLVENFQRGFAMSGGGFVPFTNDYASCEYDGIDAVLGGATATGVQSGGDIIVDSATLNGTGDDAFNAWNQPFDVSAIGTDSIGNNLVTTATAYNSHISVGDVLAFFNLNTGAFIGTTIVTAAGGGSISYAGPIGSITSCLVFLDETLAMNRIAITGNTINKIEGRGVVLQEPNSYVYANTIENNFNTCIQAFQDFGLFLEGDGPTNSVITTNNCTNNGYPTTAGSLAPLPTGFSDAQIWVYSALPGAAPGTAIAQQNISITGNTVTNSPIGCLGATATWNVSMTSNTCSTTNTANPRASSISAMTSGYITITGNTRTETTDSGPIYIDGTVSVPLNVQTSY